MSKPKRKAQAAELRKGGSKNPREAVAAKAHEAGLRNKGCSKHPHDARTQRASSRRFATQENATTPKPGAFTFSPPGNSRTTRSTPSSVSAPTRTKVAQSSASSGKRRVSFPRTSPELKREREVESFKSSPSSNFSSKSTTKRASSSSSSSSSSSVGSSKTVSSKSAPSAPAATTSQHVSLSASGRSVGRSVSVVNWNTASVKQLKAELKLRDLKTTGKPKAVLAQRILDDIVETDKAAVASYRRLKNAAATSSSSSGGRLVAARPIPPAASVRSAPRAITTSTGIVPSHRVLPGSKPIANRSRSYSERMSQPSQSFERQARPYAISSTASQRVSSSSSISSSTGKTSAARRTRTDKHRPSSSSVERPQKAGTQSSQSFERQARPYAMSSIASQRGSSAISSSSAVSSTASQPISSATNSASAARPIRSMLVAPVASVQAQEASPPPKIRVGVPVGDIDKMGRVVGTMQVQDRRGNATTVLSCENGNGHSKLYVSVELYVAPHTEMRSSDVTEFGSAKKRNFKLKGTNLRPDGQEDLAVTTSLMFIDAISKNMHYKLFDKKSMPHEIRDRYIMSDPTASADGFMENPVGSTSWFPTRQNVDIGNGSIAILFNAKSPYDARLPHHGAPTIYELQDDGTLVEHAPDSYELKVGQMVQVTFWFYTWEIGKSNVMGVSTTMSPQIIAHKRPTGGLAVYDPQSSYATSSYATPSLMDETTSVFDDDLHSSPPRRVVVASSSSSIVPTVHSFQDGRVAAENSSPPQFQSPSSRAAVTEAADKSEDNVVDLRGDDSDLDSESCLDEIASVDRPLSSHKRIRRRSSKRVPAPRRRHTAYSSPRRGVDRDSEYSCDDEFSDELPFSEGLTISSSLDSGAQPSVGHANPQRRVLSLLELEASCSDGSSDEMPSLGEASSSGESSGDDFIVSDSDEVPVYSRKSRVVFSSEED